MKLSAFALADMITNGRAKVTPVDVDFDELETTWHAVAGINSKKWVFVYVTDETGTILQVGEGVEVKRQQGTFSYYAPVDPDSKLKPSLVFSKKSS